MYETLAEEDFKQKFAFPALGPWEEEIRWTAQGKMWSFPIDNEQGLEEEQKTAFTEHIFFDHLLEPFPTKGPIRHFMELVCVGLSKNPYMTVQTKQEHIKWFAQYFEEKRHLIEQAAKELIADSTVKEAEEAKQ